MFSSMVLFAQRCDRFEMGCTARLLPTQIYEGAEHYYVKGSIRVDSSTIGHSLADFGFEG